jgi:ABC-2 type transport system ATP-binding protein
MSGSIAIETQDLQKEFGAVRALKGVSLRIEGGQIFGLLGPNGAGKTTLIRLLIGSSKATAGTLSVLDMEPVRQKRALRRLIGYMPQAPALYDDLSARDNIRFFNRALEMQRFSHRVTEAIEFVGLEERADDPVYQFSGGTKQRVSLACALARGPKLLFLDEPTSGIDPKLRASFWRHFRELAAQGVTLVVSTHQMDEAMYCDRLAVLHQGALLAVDTPQQLLWNSQSRITINKGEEATVHQATNYSLELPKLLRQHGLDPTITRIEIEEDSLEAVILDMIRRHEAGGAKEAGDGRRY